MKHNLPSQFGKVLLTLFCFLPGLSVAFSASGTTTSGSTIQLATPTLGVYPNVSVMAGQNATVTPDASPTNTLSTVAYAALFSGVLVVNPATGIVTVTDAKQAGIYTITVKAFGAGGSSATTLFTLTVTNPVCSQGLFTPQSTVGVGASPHGVAIGDFNGDGKQDLAVTNYDNSSVSIRLGDGSGGFSGSTTVSVGGSPLGIAIGDFNGDGKQDFVATNTGSSKVAIRLGDGSGGFAGTTQISVGVLPSSVAIGDFNGDGVQDIVVANTQDYTASIRLGDGNGGFTGTLDVPNGSRLYSVAISEFNTDGNQDYVTDNFYTGSASIRLGDGSGNFSDPGDASVVVGPFAVAVGDFNSDGKQDIAVTSLSAPLVSIRLGNGSGGFSGSTNVNVGTSPYGLAVGDLNGDGALDIITANLNSDNASVRLGNGSGGFSGTSNITVGSVPYAVAIGDFNLDGKQDFAVPNAGGTTVSILLGGADEINVKGNSVDIIDGDNSPSLTDYTDFGSVYLTNSTLIRTYTIQNTGSTELAISGITKSGANNPDFTLGPLTPASPVAAAGSATFTVTFNPSALGLRNASISINNNDCNEAVYDFAIQGTGINDPPVITCPANITINCQDDTTPSNTGTASATDVCSGITITYSDASTQDQSGPCSYFNYAIARTWIATDQCGSSSTCTQTITVHDITPPSVASCNANQLDTTFECNQSTNVSNAIAWNAANILYLTNCASDACGSVTVTSDFNFILFALLVGDCSYQNAVTYTITDQCQNSTTIGGTITIVDTTPPVIGSPPTNPVFQCSPDPQAAINVWIANHGNAIATDACDVFPTWSSIQISDVLGCGLSHTITYNFIVTDLCGNSSSAIGVFRVVDTTPPVFFQPIPKTFFTNAGSACPLSSGVSIPIGPVNSGQLFFVDGNPIQAPILTASPTGQAGTYSDNCLIPSLSLFYTQSTGPACFFGYQLVWTVTDACNNHATKIQFIDVFDNTPPVLNNPTMDCSSLNMINQNLCLTQAQAFDPTTLESALAALYHDNCMNSVVAMYTFSIPADFNTDCSWSFEYMFHIQDFCGNGFDCSVTYSGGDMTGPVISSPANVTIECTANTNPTVEGAGQATANDECSGNTAVSSTDVITPGSCPNNYVITRTWTSTDYCGNVSTAVQVITVADSQGPNIITPAVNMTVECDGSGNTSALSSWVTNLGGATATDNCSGVTWGNNYTGLSNDCGETGSVTVTYTATDGCGNSSQTTATFTIQDTTAPFWVNAPVNQTVECDGGGNLSALSAWLAGFTADDACGNTVVTHGAVTFSDLCATTGSATVTFTATDDCGNDIQSTAIFTILDDIPPALITGTIAGCYETVALAEAAATAATSASDDCSPTLTYVTDIQQGMDCDSIVTVTVSDVCGNVSTAQYSTRIGCQVVRLKVFLEGPYDATGDSLKTTINNLHLLPGQINTLPPFPPVLNTPHGQPYNTSPYNYNGNSGLQYGDFVGDTHYPHDVVDWILVMVREDGILPGNTIWTCAGWVHKDGTVTFPDNCPGPAIDITKDYYIVVQHRNHLGIMSPSFVDIDCDGAFLNWNFTTSDSYKVFPRVGQKLMDGIWAMFSGNGDQLSSIKVISSPDRTLWGNQQGLKGYKASDHDMNIIVNSADETLWKGNQNKTTGVVFY